MRLTERISRASGTHAPVEQAGAFLGGATAWRPRDEAVEATRELKIKVHNRLFEAIDVSRMETLDPALISAKVTSAIGETLDEDARLLTDSDRARLVDEVKNELLGLGPLEPLLRDDDVTDIMVNGCDQVFVEKRGKLHETGIHFHDDKHLMLIIDRIVSQVGRRVDESSPMVDARLRDGSRINAIIPPLAIDGPALSIRRFGNKRYSIDDLLAKDSISPEMVAMLQAMVKARLNILVSGGTGSGNTTMLNCLSSFVPHDERIVTIEDSAELSLRQTHVVRLETRPPNLEGKGEVAAAISYATPCACAPTGSSSARCAARRSSTCCRRCQPATTARSRLFMPTARASAWAGSRS
jgi:pilus assembly protein CpaF